MKNLALKNLERGIENPLAERPGNSKTVLFQVLARCEILSMLGRVRPSTQISLEKYLAADDLERILNFLCPAKFLGKIFE